jgi:hypothetical protein
MIIAVSWPVPAGERDRVAAALALAAALESTRSRSDGAHHSLSSAAQEARRNGRAVFVAVKADCSRLCRHLQSEFEVAHLTSFTGDGVAPTRSRFLLLVPDTVAGRSWVVARWWTLPDADDVRWADKAGRARLPRAASPVALPPAETPTCGPFG